jgi:ribosomal protein S6--L-glutamate ligase
MATGKDLAGMMIEHLERQVRPLSTDREPAARSGRRINVN